MKKKENPFKKYGYTPKIATLSKGKYLEWHDLDSIVIIGSVYYNTKAKKITDFVKRDMTNPDAQPLSDIRGRWISPDPLAEEFPSWSPYNFVFNNPAKFIDPTGMAPEHDYKLLQNGEVRLIRETNDNSDTLYSTNEVGQVTSESNSITIAKNSPSDTSIIGELSSGKSAGGMFGMDFNGFPGISIGYTNNVDNAVNVFNFLNTNTESNIEFGLMKFEQNGSSNNYLIGTQHSFDRLGAAFNSMLNRIGGSSNLIAFYHNHDGYAGANPDKVGNQWGTDQNTRRIIQSETLKNSSMLPRFFTVHEGLGNKTIELNRFGTSDAGTFTPGSVGSMNRINYHDVKK